MLDGLTFGWRTAILLGPAAIMLPIAAALWTSLLNRVAARFLAILLVVIVGVFTPWLIGFAGFYDRWPGLTFLPLAAPLLGPPLFWLYVRALTTGQAPCRWPLHLVPGGLQIVWQTVGFALPLDVKLRWAEATNAGANAVFTLALVAGFLVYGLATYRELSKYRLALSRARSDDVRYAARWLTRAMVAGGALSTFWTVYAVWDVIRPLGFEALMGLHLGLAAIGVFLAIEGWRHADRMFPRLQDLAPAVEPTVTERNWAELGTGWLERVRTEGWYREPDLSVSRLARLLGTNTAYVSRAFNDGLGVNFSTVINGLRSEEVASRLRKGDTSGLLQIAVDVGFSSKASFNRAFRERFDQTPQAYRRASVAPNATDAHPDPDPSSRTTQPSDAAVAREGPPLIL